MSNGSLVTCLEMSEKTEVIVLAIWLLKFCVKCLKKKFLSVKMTLPIFSGHLPLGFGKWEEIVHSKSEKPMLTSIWSKVFFAGLRSRVMSNRIGSISSM